MKPSYLTVHLDKITHNAKSISAITKRYGVQTAAVCKGVWGDAKVVRAVLDGGVRSTNGISAIADSRLSSIARLKENSLTLPPLLLLRLPALSEIEETVALTDASLNSEPSVIEALAREAVRQRKKHGIILMVELGDLREGVMKRELFAVCDEIAAIIKGQERGGERGGIEFLGLGTNLSCFGGVIPSAENLGRLVDYAKEAAEFCRLPCTIISGGNSSSLPLLMQGKMPAGINHLRLGEAILFGRETIKRTPIDGLHQNCFTLSAEIIEIKQKPSLPLGEIGEDAFGTVPHFEDRGERLRAIVNLGRADADISGITAQDKGVEILGASSDHLLLDITESTANYTVGSLVHFSVNYSALLTAMRSPSVTLQYNKTKNKE